ncbi:MAG: D-glycero-beta-D-manno-heptose-7-phosphate kinase [Desulfobacteraceae bacterium]|jgi:D-beta-D-heptose 7-phosphate kinase/D-beta-D-heptose 1-phosphate adenosyltransferase
MIRDINGGYSGKELIESINRFSRSRILVIGDIILDEFVWGDVVRISPEAPVPVVDVIEETRNLGGATNVCNNINSLGGKAIICGVVGDDDCGSYLIEKIRKLGINANGIIVDTSRPTSIKTRVIARNQQVVRFDRETKTPIDPSIMRQLLKKVEKNLDEIDAIIISDYGKGVISSHLIKAIEKLVSGTEIIIIVDPKTENFKYYKGVDIITPNHHEAGTFCGFPITDEDSLIQAGGDILNKLRCMSVLITQGKDGMTLFESGKDPCHIPTVARKVFDVSGAGDTVISTLSLGLSSGMDRESAAVVSNFAAGIAVGEVGTSAVTAKTLKAAIKNRKKVLPE